MEVRLEHGTIDALNFAQICHQWSGEASKNLTKAYKWTGQAWVAEAKKRVPVDEGRLRSSIRSNTYRDAQGVLITEVGTNVEYGKHVEFGTDRIAGGRVKALGLAPEISDTQAIHDWPAKSGEATEHTSAQMDMSGGAKGRLRNAAGQFLAVGPQEQMPWLRSAWVAIKQRAIGWINEAMKPPAA